MERFAAVGRPVGEPLCAPHPLLEPSRQKRSREADPDSTETTRVHLRSEQAADGTDLFRGQELPLDNV